MTDALWREAELDANPAVDVGLEELDRQIEKRRKWCGFSSPAAAWPLHCLWVPLDSKARKATLHSMDYRERITIDPRIRSGKPCIRGTRIAVADVFDYLGGGMSIAEVLDDFPDLTAEDIQACFAFAADRDRRLNVVPNEAAV